MGVPAGLLVSGHRVDFFPDDRSIRVSHHCYDVADHLHLHRNKVVSEVLTRFAPAFAILAEPEFADFLRGGELVHLVDIPKTYRDMHSGLAGSASGTQAVRPSSAALPEKSATPAADTPLIKAEKEGFTAFKLFKPFFEKNLPGWSKRRVANLDLGNLRCNADGLPIDPTEDDDPDAIDLQMSDGLRQFVSYGVQAMQGLQILRASWWFHLRP